MSDLGNKKIMAKNIRHFLDINNLTQTDLCGALKLKPATVSDWLNSKTYPRIDKIELMANFFGIGKSDLVEKYNPSSPSPTSFRIKVLGSVPAGIPLEAIEDIVGWEDIPLEWTAGGREYFALQVTGNSMYPKYIEGDRIILRKQSDCESGQDAVVYVNGHDATLKKVVKLTDGILLQPLNPEYVPKQYDYANPDEPVTIAGVVVEIRRQV